jgi:uncharacterized protein (DUF433 family)
MSVVRDLPPRGHYLANEVGRLAGVSGRTIGQWARRGYIRSSQSEGTPRVYSYQDAAEAMVVHALLESDVKHAAIKQTIEWLRDRHGSAWPLTRAELAVPADHPARGRRQHKSVVVASDHMTDTATDHPVLDESDLVAIAADLRRGGWAARDADLRHIEVDPNRMSGRPTIAGLRIPADDVARLAERPKGRKVLREDYELTDEQIDDAVRWWRIVRDYEHAV